VAFAPSPQPSPPQRGRGEGEGRVRGFAGEIYATLRFIISFILISFFPAFLSLFARANSATVNYDLF
jgi:hypothetical protein